MINLKKKLDGFHNKNEKNFTYFFFFSIEAKTATILDYEIENLVKDCLNLIQDTNRYSKDIEFRIILDENPNAIINEKRILFISTGLLKYIPSYAGLVGVLAHEIGHLENFHITKRIESIKNLNSLNKFGTLSIIAASILSKNNDFLLQSMVTNQITLQNYYSAFSREQEREADIYAVQTLNKLQISPDSLNEFLKILEKKSFQEGLNEENFKFLSHPIYKERFEIIENISIKQQYKFHNDLNYRFNFIKAKLFGFTENNSDNLHKYLEGDYYSYAYSIILSRKGNLKDSLKLLNKLIYKYPTNSFLIETKADLLLTHGYTNEAKKFYQKVYKKDLNNKYVKKRIFEIEFEKIDQNKDSINQEFFINFLELIIIFDNDVFLLRKFKKIAVLNKDYEWINFIDANILLINNKENMALEKLNNILQNSKKKKLIELTKKTIRKISNE